MDIRQSMMAMRKYYVNLVILDSSPIHKFMFIKSESENIIIIACNGEIRISASLKEVL